MREFLLIFLVTVSPVLAEGPVYKHRDTVVSQEFDNVYQDIRSIPRFSSISLSGGITCIDDPTFCVDGNNNQVKIASGTAAAPSLILGEGEDNSGLYRHAAETIGFTSNGSSTLRIGGGALTMSGTGSQNTVQILDGSSGSPGLTFRDDTDNGMLRIGANNWGFSVAGATATIYNSGGEVTQPLQPSFLVYASANITDVTGDNTVVTVTYDTEVFDRGSDLTNSTFTASVSGIYGFALSTRLNQISSTTHTNANMSLVTSNRTYLWRIASIPGTLTTLFPVISVYADMDANDTARVEVEVDGSSKVVDIGGSAILVTYFSGSLIN